MFSNPDILKIRYNKVYWKNSFIYSVSNQMALKNHSKVNEFVDDTIMYKYDI